MLCPKCNSEMVEVMYEGITIDRCRGCSGLWFDVGEVDALREKLIAEFVDTGDAEVGQRYDQIDDINCPRCGQVMKSNFDLEHAQIMYESCDAHGQFFDAGEFSRWVEKRLDSEM